MPLSINSAKAKAADIDISIHTGQVRDSVTEV